MSLGEKMLIRNAPRVRIARSLFRKEALYPQTAFRSTLSATS